MARAVDQWNEAVEVVDRITLDDMAEAAILEADRLKIVHIDLVDSALRAGVDKGVVRLSEVHRRTAIFLDQVAPHQHAVIKLIKELNRKSAGMWGKRK